MVPGLIWSDRSLRQPDSVFVRYRFPELLRSSIHVEKVLLAVGAFQSEHQVSTM